jgi:ubiquinone/menaquinone biosynthesis C-methylase UbiE
MRNDTTFAAEFYNQIAPKYDSLKKRNNFYHQELEKLYTFLIPKKQSILEIGCATGDLLSSLQPLNGVGIDIAENMILLAQKKHPSLQFKKKSAEKLSLSGRYDYIILSDLVGILDDIQLAFMNIEKIADEDTRIIINFYNYIWEPFLELAAAIGLKVSQPQQNWLSYRDIENILTLSNLEVVKESKFLLIPFYIPLLSTFFNKYLARLPLLRQLCFVHYIVARKKPVQTKKEYSVSLILPARNEAGNIERAIKEIPNLGLGTEIIFVEDHSTDNTRTVIKNAVKNYKGEMKVRFFVQTKEKGKAAAVRHGLSEATGDIVFVFDSDLTTMPKDLPKFYDALKNRTAEFIQGSRLVYPMEKEAMRFLNVMGNKFFSIAFSFLLDQQIKDTLCGTKGLFRKNYEKIYRHRAYFGNFDPFGDFDLIFGSAKLNLKIAEIPIRYKARTYGKTNIKRFRNGIVLLQMTAFAAKKIKFF